MNAHRRPIDMCHVNVPAHESGTPSEPLAARLTSGYAAAEGYRSNRYPNMNPHWNPNMNPQRKFG